RSTRASPSPARMPGRLLSITSNRSTSCREHVRPGRAGISRRGTVPRDPAVQPCCPRADQRRGHCRNGLRLYLGRAKPARLGRAGAGMLFSRAGGLALGAGLAAMIEAGAFDALWLPHESRPREAQFAGALTRHVELVLASVGVAVIAGFPLGVAAVRRPGWQGPVFAVLNLLQTIPSIALFGLLIVPLSAVASAFPSFAAVGIGGIGVAAALIALVLYV